MFDSFTSPPLSKQTERDAGLVHLSLRIHQSAVRLAEVPERYVIGFRQHLHGT
jgi:hypothetical protein